MFYETSNGLITLEPAAEESADQRAPQNLTPPAAPAPVATAAVLPPGVAVTERGVAALRAHLVANGLGHYRIFYCANLDLNDIEEHLEALGERGAAWEMPPAFVAGGEPMVGLTHSDDRAKVWEVGFLRLAQSEIVLARRYWLAGDSEYRTLLLCAAPSAEHYLRLHRRVLDLRHADAKAVWLVVRGHAHYDRTPIPRDLSGAADDLVLSPALRQRVEADVLRFFDPQVAELYKTSASRTAGAC
jgi:hypothetical protein